MSEHPILFSAPMVRAILEGRKTQTRRAIRIQPQDAKSFGIIHSHSRLKSYSIIFLDSEGEDEAPVSNIVKCPYGQVGDTLWVREAWAKTFCLGQEMIVYKTGDNRTDYGGPWKPSIHMPRTASRINLEVTDVRVERLHEISGKDALAEGMTIEAFIKGEAGGCCPIGSYALLWEKINGLGSWDKNPWVWVIEFERVTK